MGTRTGGAEGEKERQPSKIKLPKYTPFMQIKKGGGDAQKDTGPARFTAGEDWAGEGDRRDGSDRRGSTRASRTSINKQGLSPTRPKRASISKQDNRPNRVSFGAQDDTRPNRTSTSSQDTRPNRTSTSTRAFRTSINKQGLTPTHPRRASISMQDNRPNRVSFGAQDDTRPNRISTSSQDTRPNRTSTSMQGMQEDPSRNRPSPSMQDDTHRRRPSTCMADGFNTGMQEETLRTVRPHTVPASIGDDFNSNRIKSIKRHSFTSIFQRAIPNEILISLPPLKKDNEAEEYFKDLKPVSTNMVSRIEVIKDKIKRSHEAGRSKLEYSGQYKLRLSAMHMKLPL